MASERFCSRPRREFPCRPEYRNRVVKEDGLPALYEKSFLCCAGAQSPQTLDSTCKLLLVIKLLRLTQADHFLDAIKRGSSERAYFVGTLFKDAFQCWQVVDQLIIALLNGLQHFHNTFSQSRLKVAIAFTC